MPVPRRPRQTPLLPRHSKPIISLGNLVRDHENWRRSLPGKPSRGTLLNYWQKLDALHAGRPDYLLWRATQCTDSPPTKKHDLVDLGIRALRASEPVIYEAAVTLLPDILEAPLIQASPKREFLLQALQERLKCGVKSETTTHASALIHWMAYCLIEPVRATRWSELNSLFQATQPNWKLGRKIDLLFWETNPPSPLSRTQMMRRLAVCIHQSIQAQTRQSQNDAADLTLWHLTAWMLLRDSRPEQSPPPAIEIEVLLSAATTARLAGDADQAARLTALSLHQVPTKAPDPLLQRCRIAALSLAEAGLASTPAFKTNFDDLPFPGDSPATENGRAVARRYLDESDIFHYHLTNEVQHHPEWEVLRQNHIALHHPLAALAWVARKAQAYSLKKQHSLLQAAATLAMRHQRLTSLGRLLPYLPPSSELILNYAAAIRQTQRRMPFLRDQEIWQDWTLQLRIAWSRIEPETLQDPEQIFLLHETLHDREVTLSRSLPYELRVLALRHLHTRKLSSPLIQALASDPRQMQQLEHQRQVELWSITTELRERPELTSMAWISLVMRGEPSQGRYSLLVQGPAGRVIHQDRLRPNDNELDWSPLLGIIRQAVAQVNAHANHLLIALDPMINPLPWNSWLRLFETDFAIHFIPSWEWAFRVLRESISTSSDPSEWLLPETLKSSIPESISNQPLPPDTCVLLAAGEVGDANTRWLNLHALDMAPKRSLQIGTFRSIISASIFERGAFSQDLVRLSLAQSTRSFITPTCVLNEEQHQTFQKAPLSLPVDWIRFGL